CNCLCVAPPLTPSVGCQNEPRIALCVINCYDAGSGAERKPSPKFSDCGEGGNGSEACAHHATCRQSSYPANIASASDGFTSQVKTPGGERVAKSLAHYSAANQRGRQCRRRDTKIASRFKHEK